MKYPAYSLALIVLIGVTSVAFGQGKGVDAQNQRITDTGNSRAAGNNGTKQDTGTTGSGITWGKDKTRTTTVLPNPYRVTGRRGVQAERRNHNQSALHLYQGCGCHAIGAESFCSSRDGGCPRLDSCPIH